MCYNRMLSVDQCQMKIYNTYIKQQLQIDNLATRNSGIQGENENIT